MTSLISSFIDGAQIVASSGDSRPVVSPRNAKVLRLMSYASDQQVSECIESAERGFKVWNTTPAVKRAEVLFKFYHLLDRHRAELAQLISEEHGKLFNDAMGEVARGIEVVQYACGAPSLLKGEFSENVGREIDSYSIRQAIGVVVGITPFNFPAMVPMWMFPIALACGNSFILKPSEKVPTTALRIAELLTEAGCPDGVFNVLLGEKDVVDRLLNSPKVHAISFVGSTPVAKHIYTTGTALGKRVQALGGAKNHMIVMPDTDIIEVKDALMGAAYGSAGERCMAISVAVVVGDQAADQLTSLLIKSVQKLQIGTQADDDMGPLISAEHRARVVSYIESGIDDGAALLVDGRDREFTGDGYLIGGSLFDHVSADMKIYRDEIFGPVLCVCRVGTYEQALEMINEHEFGNGAVIYTASGALARHFSNNVKAGMVGVNVPIPVPPAYHSFGGWKVSLFGDHHVHGPEGIRFYTKLKVVTSRWKAVDRQKQFAMPTYN